MDTCRQCRSVVPLKTAYCPVCGLLRPRLSELSALEKKFLTDKPPLPPDVEHDLIEEIDGSKSIFQNLVTVVTRHLADVQRSALSWMALSFMLLGLFLCLTPYSLVGLFMLGGGAGYLFLRGLVRFEAFSYTVMEARLQRGRSLAPFPVHFKIERQITGLISGLRTLTHTVVDGGKSADAVSHALKASRVIIERVATFAELSLEMTAIVWRSQVAAILAGDLPSEEKAHAVSIKCREAEALLLRHRWLLGFESLPAALEEHLAQIARGDQPPPHGFPNPLDTFHLNMYGPLRETVLENFDRSPDELPFMGRSFWHQRLLPMPLDDGTLAKMKQATDLIASLQKVRQVKGQLEEQAAIDEVVKAITGSSGPDGAMVTAVEARAAARDASMSRFIGIQDVQADTQAVEEAVDRMMAEARVAIGSEKTFG